MFGPKRTFSSVVQELVSGLQDGTVVLSAGGEEARADQSPILRTLPESIRQPVSEAADRLSAQGLVVRIDVRNSQVAIVIDEPESREGNPTP